jgi:hypothetical protein
MAGTVCWARLVVASPDGTHQEVMLAGEGPPGLAVVELVARCQLLARRAGGRVWLEEMSPALAELLSLAGLLEEMVPPR